MSETECISLIIYGDQAMNQMKNYMRTEVAKFFPQAKVEYFV